MKAGLVSLLTVSAVASGAILLTPEGGGRRVMKLLASAMVFLSFLSLLGKITLDWPPEEYKDYESEARKGIIEGKTELENEILENLRTVCEKKALEKAESLGLQSKVSVTVAVHSEKGYIAEAVTVHYLKRPEEDAAAAFKRWISEELGVPLKRQTHIFDP